MKRILIAVVSLAVSAVIFTQEGGASSGGILPVHFFTSGVCPACKQAGRELPAMLGRYPRLRLRTYEVRDAMNRVNDLHRRNMALLVRLLQDIKTRTKGGRFIYEGRTPHAFVAVRGVPYYEKKISATTTVKKEIPVPVFVMGDRVYIGYRQEIISRALAEYHGGR
ncbi:MAG: hypothetical protein JW838_14490 [Spirochaetes bacterium]|nr:hypothetical protein [Spirochaetota bacterium]